MSKELHEDYLHDPRLEAVQNSLDIISESMDLVLSLYSERKLNRRSSRVC